MEEQNVKVIDVYDVLKFLWKSKILILICIILMIGVAIFGINRNVKPSYMTSIQVRLPQYVDDRTVNTAVTYAMGNMLINFYKQQDMNPDNPDITITAEAIKNSTIVRIQFVGQEPERIKEFADTYQIAYINGLNQFVNEKAINDFEISQAQNNSSESLTQLEKNLPLAKAEVIKDGGIPTSDLNANTKLKNIIKFGILGFLIGCGISVVCYAVRLFKVNEKGKN